MKYSQNPLLRWGAFATLGLAQIASADSTLPGEDSSMAILPGQGFNTIRRDTLGHCVQLGDYHTQSGQETGQIAEYLIREVKSETDMREQFGLSATVTLMAYIYGNPTGRANFVFGSRITTQNRYLLVKTRVGQQLELASRYTYDPEVLRFIRETDSDEDAFVNQCGNEFVSGRRRGVEFYALIEFATLTHEQTARFDAAAAGSYNGWRGVLNANYDLSRFQGIAETRVHMLQLGGLRPFPQVEDLEEFARNYSSLVDLSQDGPVTLELNAKVFGGVFPLQSKLKFNKMRDREATVRDLALNREKVTTLRADIAHIRANLAFYQYDRKVHTFDEWLRQLQYFSDANDDISRDCLRGEWEKCTIPPTHKMPTIVLPVRKTI